MTATDLGLISFDHKDLIENAFSDFPPEISEHTFSNLFVWRHMRPLHVINVNGSLIFAEIFEDHIEVFGPPAGKINISESLIALESLFNRSVHGYFRIPSSRISEMSATFSVIEDRNNFDYVYAQSDLAELKGNEFHAKKNLVNQCLQTYDCEYEELSSKNIKLISEFQERWCKQRKCNEEHSLCHEFLAISEMLTHYDEKKILGGLIKINGTIQAYTIGEKLNHDTAVVHFEKADSSIKGLYQLINHWFAKNSLTQFKFINREQDLGIEGLRKAKMSYNPVKLVEKYSLTSSAFETDPHKNHEKKCE